MFTRNASSAPAKATGSATAAMAIRCAGVLPAGARENFAVLGATVITRIAASAAEVAM